MPFDPITAALDIGGKVIDRLWPDPTQAAAAKMQLLQMQQTGELAKLTADTDLEKAQDAINQAEASNNSIFVSGARPFILWVCGSAVAYTFIFGPLVGAAVRIWQPNFALPVLDSSDLMALMTGMLGLGATHAYENIQVSKNK